MFRDLERIYGLEVIKSLKRSDKRFVTFELVHYLPTTSPHIGGEVDRQN
jgi:hypothetical protein